MTKEDKKATATATAPRKRRVNRRAETAANVRQRLAEAGAVLDSSPELRKIAGAIFDLGYAMGEAEAGNLDEMTLAFAQDLAKSGRDRAIAALERTTKPATADPQ
jgi:hypothetical protein